MSKPLILLICIINLFKEAYNQEIEKLTIPVVVSKLIKNDYAYYEVTVPSNNDKDLQIFVKNKDDYQYSNPDLYASTVINQ